MKKMITSLRGVFLIAAVMVMPLYGMAPGVAKKTANNVELLNEIVEQAHKVVDAAMATLTVVDKKQQKLADFEVAKRELVQLIGKVDFAAIDLNKIDLNGKIKMAQLMKKMDPKAQITMAPFMEKIDFKTKLKLAQLMKKIDLDTEIKKLMGDAMTTIQNTRAGTASVPTDVAWESIEESQDAYGRLLDLVVCITEVVSSEGKIQLMIDYVTRKFQEAKQAVRVMWYGA
jgi:hypothetical protein